MYQIEYFNAAKKDLSVLPNDVFKRVSSAIDALAENPRPSGAVKLKGGGGYRLRVGDYRILYLISDAVKIVSIYRVRHRKEAYD